MPRRSAATIRPVEPDPLHRSKLVQQVINRVMLDGKKSTAERIVYDALAILSERTGKDPVEALETSIKALTPVLEVSSRRVGGATYQVPVEVPPAAPAPSRSAGSSSSPATGARSRWRSASPTSCSTPSPSRAARTSARTTSSAWHRPTRPSRTTAGSALALLIAGAFAAPAAAATLDAPGSVAPREVVAVTVDGLEPGPLGRLPVRGRLRRPPLPRRARAPHRPRRASRPCSAASRRARAATAHARRAARLAAPAAGPTAGRPASPRPSSPAAATGSSSASRTGGTPQAAVARRSRRAARARARRSRSRPTPTTARSAPRAQRGLRGGARVARGARGRRPRYRRAGLRCRGVFDDARLRADGLPLPRPAARVTSVGRRWPAELGPLRPRAEPARPPRRRAGGRGRARRRPSPPTCRASPRGGSPW